jgi:hypothetical protein
MAGSSRLKSPGISSMRFYALLAALAIYALLGSPTPDNPGFAEAVVGMLLVFATGPVYAANILRPEIHKDRPWGRVGKVLLLYGLTIPVVAGLVNGNDTGNILRDIFPFIFMLMPLFLTRTVCTNPASRNRLIFAVFFIGIVFSLRSQFPGGVNPEFITFSPVLSSEQLYLVNAPTVLFTALLLIGLSFERLSGLRRKEIGPLMLSGMAVIAAITIEAMAAAFQRASMGALMIMLFWLVVKTLINRPARLLIPVTVFVVAGVFFWPQILELWDLLIRKTLNVGLNNRVQEALAVIEVMQDDLFAVLFGKGWGATFASPAVGGIEVNFTHCLLTAYFLKTGIIGMILAVIYLAGFAKELFAAFKWWPVAALALAAPLLINTFLYASYKSVDFGLILLLCVVFSKAAGKLRKGSEYSIQDGLQFSPKPESG